MRIIGGKKRGTLLATPDSNLIRPTKDQVREGIFAILKGGRYRLAFDTLVVADVFAGTGAMGLEAWSQGAKQVIFIEQNRVALEILEKNIKKLGLGGDAIIIDQDATAPILWPAPPADLIFLDPPWQRQNDDLAHGALVNLIDSKALAPNAIISIEHDRRGVPLFPEQIEILETRQWGRTACTLMRYTGDAG